MPLCLLDHVKLPTCINSEHNLWISSIIKKILMFLRVPWWRKQTHGQYAYSYFWHWLELVGKTYQRCAATKLGWLDGHSPSMRSCWSEGPTRMRSSAARKHSVVETSGRSLKCSHREPNRGHPSDVCSSRRLKSRIWKEHGLHRKIALVRSLYFRRYQYNSGSRKLRLANGYQHSN